jgi:streptogramin lyase
MKKVKLASILLAVMITGCATITPDNAISPETSPGLTDSEITGFNKEYSAFNTKALTMEYLLRKINFWIDNDKGEQLVKELKFARFKYPLLLGEILIPDQDLLYTINQIEAVSTERSINPDFALFLDSFLDAVAPESTAVVTTLAGNDDHYVDAAALDSSFYGPDNMVYDSQGNLFISEPGNRVIRKIDTNGQVTTFAGNNNDSHYASVDGTGTNATFGRLGGITIDNDNNLYVVENDFWHQVRKITPDGEVSLLAGSPDIHTRGSDNGDGTSALFFEPMDITFSGGNLYVSDLGNNKIRKVTLSGTVTDFASVSSPWGISSSNGNLYVALYFAHQIKMVDSNGNVSGIATSASLGSPQDIVKAADGNIYYTDRQNNTIKKITTGNAVSVIAGKNRGFANGNGTNASFSEPMGIITDNQGNLLVADGENNGIRKIDPSGNVTTFAGCQSYNDGIGTNARFYYPQSLTHDDEGNMYIADTGNRRIRKMDSSGNVTTFAGNGKNSYTDATGTDAAFGSPYGIVIDSSGNLFVTDSENNVIRKIDQNGEVTTFAGNGDAGSDDDPAGDATFDSPRAITIDPDDNLYIVDFGSYKVRMVTPGGDVTTIADGNDADPPLDSSSAIARDNSGNLFIADANNGYIFKLDTGGEFSRYVGNGEIDFKDGKGTNASVNEVTGLAIDNDGNIYFADASNQRVRKIDPARNVTTIAGNEKDAEVDGIGTNAFFWNPTGIMLDENGDLIVVESGGNRIRKIDLE